MEDWAIESEGIQTKLGVNNFRGLEISLVPGERIELSLPCENWILSPTRLPVPPSRPFSDSRENAVKMYQDLYQFSML